MIRVPILVLGFLSRSFRSVRPERRRTVLLIRVDALGDFVVFTPAIAAIRMRYHDWHLIVVVQEGVAELARTCPYVDEVIGVDREKYRYNPLYAISVLREVRQQRSAICINAMYSHNIMSEEIALWSDSTISIGWRGTWGDSLSFLKACYDRTYTTLLQDMFSLGTHELQRHKTLLSNLGAQSENLVPQLWHIEPPSLVHPSQCVEEALQIERSIIVVPGSEDPTRRWPLSNYAEIVARLHARYPAFHVLMVGSEKDKRATLDDGIRKEFAGMLDLRGKTSTLDLIQLVKRSSLVLGNETGPLHVAIALGIPTVCILGGGHYGRFMPYGDPEVHQVVTQPLECFGCDWKCVRSRVECILDIPVDRVWEAVGKTFRGVYSE